MASKNSQSVTTEPENDGFGADDEDEDDGAEQGTTGKRGRKAEPDDMTPADRFRARANANFVIIRQKLAAAKKFAGRDNLEYTDAQVEKLYSVILADLDSWRTTMLARETVVSDDLDIL